jgi:uncharacterized repeat protein (TIGR03803 family)
MFRVPDLIALSGCCATIALLPTATGAGGPHGFRVLYNFCAEMHCADGYDPEAGVIIDGAGNLYGTTARGGTKSHGVVFKLAPDGTESVLHVFQGRQDGSHPMSDLIADATGDLYGTTADGGRKSFGTVFKLAPDGTEMVLHAFAGGSDGSQPRAGLIADGNGNLYGTASAGGSNNCGVIYRLAPDGTETVLHSFGGGFNDGCNPAAALIADRHGNLFGTTANGGEGSAGVVFRLGRHRETVLHSFCAKAECRDGANPVAALIEDRSGNLYGTAPFGDGCADVVFPDGCGVVFEVAPSGRETTLFPFNVVGGADPSAALTADGKGNLYGTTLEGFGGNLPANRNGYGVAFKLGSDGSETVLHGFGTTEGGCFPGSRLLRDGHGDLYGTATSCGAHYGGTVFVVKE